jgi:hypothetical protein
MPATPRDRVEAALLAAAGSSTSRLAGARPIAVGWATVDVDRAVVDLAAAFGLGPERFRPTARSIALGCVGRVARGVLLDGGSLALLEPDSEGRLAASLARLGEGPIVTWLLAPEPKTSVEALRTAGFTLSAERSGPFGLERLVVDGSRHGPHRLLVGPSPGTITG